MLRENYFRGIPAEATIKRNTSERRRADHLEEREVSDEAVVEVDFGREPGVVVERRQRQAVVLGRDDVETDQLAVDVDAAAELAAKQVDAHDAEDEPEDEADEQHVEDGRDRLDQRVHHHLQRRRK